MTKNKKTKKPSSVRRATTKKQSLSLLAKDRLLVAVISAAVLVMGGSLLYYQQQSGSLDSFHAEPYYNKVKPLARPSVKPQTLLTPSSVRSTYHLSSKSVGKGTIAIIDAYDDPTIAADLAVFNKQYKLPTCTTANGCFVKHKMSSKLAVDPTWAIEDALDVEWAHAIAPAAKILLVEAKSANGADLLNAINYAKAQRDVVAISMSWGGDEFRSEPAYESAFTSKYGAVFFAASGDSGHGTSWPAVSANVISVGGTGLSSPDDDSLDSVIAWSGSGGGVSTYINEPLWQTNANIPQANGHRAVPDVAYNADPSNGYAVYNTTRYAGHKGWFQVGGTSAGAPQWAAIASISNKTLTIANLYRDAMQPGQTKLRDITDGTNGDCDFFCDAQPGFDYLTGFGEPLATKF